MVTGIMLLGAAACPHSTASPIDLSGALRAGEVRITATALGGHGGPCLKVDAENLTMRELILRIPSGWRFPSVDTTQQDLLVVGDRLIALAPKGRGAATCMAFCCEADDADPVAANAYGQGQLADERLVKLAQHLASGGYTESAMQHAVWAVGSGIPISAIDAGDGAATMSLREFVAGITGRPVPWHTTAFEAPAAGRAFNPAPVRITGRVDFEQRHGGLLSIVVKDSDGRTVHVLDEGRQLHRGRYAIEVELSVRGWAHGRYRICFATDGVLVKEQPFEL